MAEQVTEQKGAEHKTMVYCYRLEYAFKIPGGRRIAPRSGGVWWTDDPGLARKLDKCLGAHRISKEECLVRHRAGGDAHRSLSLAFETADNLKPPPKPRLAPAPAVVDEQAESAKEATPAAPLPPANQCLGCGLQKEFLDARGRCVECIAAASPGPAPEPPPPPPPPPADEDGTAPQDEPGDEVFLGDALVNTEPGEEDVDELPTPGEVEAMSKSDCREWLEANGLELPKSRATTEEHRTAVSDAVRVLSE